MFVKEITKRYDGKAVVDGVSFEVPKGKVLSLIGPNGAGKSTLMKCLFGIYKMDAGEILLDGEKIEINRFFAEAQDYPDRKEVSVGHGLVEITYEEYVGRKVIAGALRKEIILKQCEMNCAAFENCSYKEEHSENYDWECDKEGSVNT